MIYRKLDADGDYTFGKRSGNFYKDQPEAVAQAVRTRLGLIEGEWFLDTTAGTPYDAKILGAGRIATYDMAIQDVIRTTPGVKRLLKYSSGVDQNTRKARVECEIDTIYGAGTLRLGYGHNSAGLLDSTFILDQSRLS